MTHRQLRRQFIRYFAAKEHLTLPAAPLIPPSDDPSVLFTVAGVQPFKVYYTHPEAAPSPRIVTIQPCVRTVDIDEVGDEIHATLFEMLGHFSFGYLGSSRASGPYFKAEAIAMAWEFLTAVLKIAPARLRATYFGGDAQRRRDEESQAILGELPGLSLVEAAGEDNFWGPVGREGPCGPTVEFYIDNLEVWNTVFNEYHRDKAGNYTSLPTKGVDMGSGLERLLAVVEGESTIYATDLLAPFLKRVKEGSVNYAERQGRIILDHSKAALFLLTAGVHPGNKGRDYIVRRLIRRAVRTGQLIGFSQFSDLLAAIGAEYAPLYPSIKEQGRAAGTLFESERRKFLQSLKAGTKRLASLLSEQEKGEISGREAFRLFDTYGFPVELTGEMAHEAGWTVDLDGFAAEFARHRELSKAGVAKIFEGGLADHQPQTIAHHTAHHLLLAALRQVLGPHVVQRGSNITTERLRLDITQPEKISDEQLRMVSTLVNQKIAEDLPVVSEIMDREEALALGTLAEFGAKYPPKACVYSIIDQDGSVFSREFCGGPHAKSTGELGQFEILKEEALGAGIRRLRARTSPKP